MQNVQVILLKGNSLTDLTAMYNVKPGQTYTASRFSNLYLQFIATEKGKGGAFTFNVGYTSLSGRGYKEPEKATIVQEEEVEFVEDTEPVVTPEAPE